MSNNDSKIIKRFPEATPYELLTIHGLSQKGYNELLTNPGGKPKPETPEPEKPKNLLVPDKVVETTKHRIAPQTSTLAATTRGADQTTVRLKNVATGKEFNLSRFAADRWLKKHGVKFSIVG